jgi:hypothetical protein
MTNLRRPRSLSFKEALALKKWQCLLALTRLVAEARRWAGIFNRNRSLMALAFLGGMLLGLLPLLR